MKNRTNPPAYPQAAASTPRTSPFIKITGPGKISVALAFLLINLHHPLVIERMFSILVAICDRFGLFRFRGSNQINEAKLGEGPSPDIDGDDEK